MLSDETDLFSALQLNCEVQ